MQLAKVVAHGYFHPAHKVDAKGAGGFPGFGKAGQRVVIRQGHGGQTEPGRFFHQIRRLVGAVGNGAVGVQINVSPGHSLSLGMVKGRLPAGAYRKARPAGTWKTRLAGGRSGDRPF